LLQKKKTVEAATLKKEMSKADKLALKDEQAKLKLQKEAERLAEKAKKEEVRFLCTDACRSQVAQPSVCGLCWELSHCSPCGTSVLKAASALWLEQEKRVKEEEKRTKEEEKEAKVAEREAKKVAKEEKAALPKKPQSAYLFFSCERCALHSASYTRPHVTPQSPHWVRGPASSAPLPFYCFFRRAAVKDSNPETSFAEVAKLLGNEWAQLSDEDKRPWEEKAVADKERYASEVRGCAS